MFSKFTFTEESFKLVFQLALLYDATNTNLRPIQQHGGKLIMWHGLADVSVTPWVSTAYYEAVQKQFDSATTDTFVRLFLISGVSRCGGGEGFQQIDLLTPLMAWTEMKQAPKMLAGDRIASSGGPGGPGGVALPCAQACLWIYEGTLPRIEEEPRMAVCGICGDQHLSAPPETGEDQFADGPAMGVVCAC
jgi:hypothetical protein